MFDFINDKLSSKEKEILGFYQNGATYKEIMNHYQIENPKFVDNAIQNVKRKINLIHTLEEKLVQLKEIFRLDYPNIALSSTLSYEELSTMEEMHGLDLPSDYFSFLEEISNGFVHNDIKVFSFEEMILNRQNDSYPLLQWEQNILFYSVESDDCYIEGSCDDYELENFKFLSTLYSLL